MKKQKNHWQRVPVGYNLFHSSRSWPKVTVNQDTATSAVAIRKEAAYYAGTIRGYLKQRDMGEGGVKVVSGALGVRNCAIRQREDHSRPFISGPPFSKNHRVSQCGWP
jgi:hypothetical protein